MQHAEDMSSLSSSDNERESLVDLLSLKGVAFDEVFNVDLVHIRESIARF